MKCPQSEVMQELCQYSEKGLHPHLLPTEPVELGSADEDPAVSTLFRTFFQSRLRWKKI